MEGKGGRRNIIIKSRQHRLFHYIISWSSNEVPWGWLVSSDLRDKGPEEQKLGQKPGSRGRNKTNTH